jgi:hypothetical protein
MNRLMSGVIQSNREVVDVFEPTLAKELSNFLWENVISRRAFNSGLSPESVGKKRG